MAPILLPYAYNMRKKNGKMPAQLYPSISAISRKNMSIGTLPARPGSRSFMGGMIAPIIATSHPPSRKYNSLNVSASIRSIEASPIRGGRIHTGM
jgi:hypothetical protein